MIKAKLEVMQVVFNIDISLQYLKVYEILSTRDSRIYRSSQ